MQSRANRPGHWNTIIALAVVAWLATTSAAATLQQTPPSPQAPGKPPDDQAAALFVRMCNECHDTGRISSTRRTRTDWEDQIDQMIQEGAKGTDKEFETVIGYLLRTFGKVYINSAKADEIVAVLTLSQKDADAIVAYRTANGKFADFDALKKVPGIDLKKLEARQDAVGF
jgi:competence protein ComEA